MIGKWDWSKKLRAPVVDRKIGINAVKLPEMRGFKSPYKGGGRTIIRGVEALGNVWGKVGNFLINP